MPLHLLGKKSWNPYAPAAIAKVKADEEAAEAHELALDEARDEYDADVRLARMRGESPPPKPAELLRLESVDPTSQSRKRSADELLPASDRRKLRRLPGEDDTDRDLRLARESRGSHDSRNDKSKGQDARRSEAPIVDRDGHIQLFAPAKDRSQRQRADKNAEAESERKERERRFEDQYTMRFSNASGLQQDTKQDPWYLNNPDQPAKGIGRNAFGREDENRHQRDDARMNAADPMAAMKAAQTKLKSVQEERDRARQEKLRELEDLREEQSREDRRRHRRRHRDRDHEGHGDPDVLEGFNLDAEPSSSKRSRSRHRHRHRHHRHHSSDRRSKSPRRDRRR